MRDASSSHEFSDLQQASAQELVNRVLRATWNLAQIEIALAQNEVEQQIQSALNTIAWGAVAFGSIILSLAGILIAASLAGGSNRILIAGTGAAIAACVALVAATVAYRTRPRQLLARTRERLGYEATLLGKHIA
ncbi:MAG TPA: phage holin family protein [Polyangiaceae bacterium]|jgi:hypothetical protein|nr:phage holin family protein [Polyangiaceae bacterium]